MTTLGNGCAINGVSGSLPCPLPSLPIAWWIFGSPVTLATDLESNRLSELEASLHDIQSQLTQPSPNTSLINSSLATVKRILEGAATNVLASGWLKVLGGLV